MQKRDVLRHVGIIAILSIATSVALNILLLHSALPQYSTRYQEASVILYSPPFWQQIVYNGIAAPIIEELLFRGVLFRVLRRWVAFPWAMIISAVVFGAYHGNLVQFVYAGICGVLLAYLCEKYDSIIAPIVSHMVMNTVAIVFTQWGVFAQIMKSSVVAVLAMLVCTVCAVVMLRVLQKLDVTKVLKIYCKE
jgi:membrane protease YdiL (CAAX protease family)